MTERSPNQEKSILDQIPEADRRKFNINSADYVLGYDLTQAALNCLLDKNLLNRIGGVKVAANQFGIFLRDNGKQINSQSPATDFESLVRDWCAEKGFILHTQPEEPNQAGTGEPITSTTGLPPLETTSVGSQNPLSQTVGTGLDKRAENDRIPSSNMVAQEALRTGQGESGKKNPDIRTVLEDVSEIMALDHKSGANNLSYVGGIKTVIPETGQEHTGLTATDKTSNPTVLSWHDAIKSHESKNSPPKPPTSKLPESQSPTRQIPLSETLNTLNRMREKASTKEKGIADGTFMTHHFLGEIEEAKILKQLSADKTELENIENEIKALENQQIAQVEEELKREYNMTFVGLAENILSKSSKQNIVRGLLETAGAKVTAIKGLAPGSIEAKLTFIPRTEDGSKGETVLKFRDAKAVQQPKKEPTTKFVVRKPQQTPAEQVKVSVTVKDNPKPAEAPTLPPAVPALEAAPPQPVTPVIPEDLIAVVPLTPAEASVVPPVQQTGVEAEEPVTGGLKSDVPTKPVTEETPLPDIQETAISTGESGPAVAAKPWSEITKEPKGRSFIPRVAHGLSKIVPRKSTPPSQNV